MKTKTLLLALPLLLLSCNGASLEEKSKADEMPPSTAGITYVTPPADPVPQNPLPDITKDPQVTTDTTGASPGKKSNTPADAVAEKQLIQTADIRMQVKDLDACADTIEALMKNYGAYLSNATQQSSNYGSEAAWCIRVQQQHFNPLIKALTSQAQFINHKNISTDDVTAEYVDIQTRLKTKKEVQARYIDILRNKARTVDEVLKAENEIRVLQEEIEAKTGRLNLIRDQASWSTIHLTFYQQVAYAHAPETIQYSWTDDMAAAFSTGWNGLKKLVVGLTYIWPFYVFLFLVYLALRKYLFTKDKKNIKA